MCSYYDSAEGITISQEQARKEIMVKHQHTREHFEEFLKEVGNKPTYNAQVVLKWLGY
jgi:hypothetical protein